MKGKCNMDSLKVIAFHEAKFFYYNRKVIYNNIVTKMKKVFKDRDKITNKECRHFLGQHFHVAHHLQTKMIKDMVKGDFLKRIDKMNVGFV